MFIRYYFKRGIAYVINNNIETVESVDVNKYSFIDPKINLDKGIMEGEVRDYVESPIEDVVNETVESEEVNSEKTVK